MNTEPLGYYSAEFEPLSMQNPWEAPPRDYAFFLVLLAVLLWTLFPFVFGRRRRIGEERQP